VVPRWAIVHVRLLSNEEGRGIRGTLVLLGSGTQCDTVERRWREYVHEAARSLIHRTNAMHDERDKAMTDLGEGFPRLFLGGNSKVHQSKHGEAVTSADGERERAQAGVKRLGVV
jgi:hypothetical protein